MLAPMGSCQPSATARLVHMVLKQDGSDLKLMLKIDLSLERPRLTLNRAVGHLVRGQPAMSCFWGLSHLPETHSYQLTLCVPSDPSWSAASAHRACCLVAEWHQERPSDGADHTCPSMFAQVLFCQCKMVRLILIDRVCLAQDGICR